MAKLKGREEKAELEEQEKRLFSGTRDFPRSKGSRALSIQIPVSNPTPSQFKLPGSALGALPHSPSLFQVQITLWNDKALARIHLPLHPWEQPGIHQQWQPGEKTPCWKFGKEDKWDVSHWCGFLVALEPAEVRKQQTEREELCDVRAERGWGRFPIPSALGWRQIMKYLWNEEEYLQCDGKAVSRGQQLQGFYLPRQDKGSLIIWYCLMHPILSSQSSPCRTSWSSTGILIPIVGSMFFSGIVI